MNRLICWLKGCDLGVLRCFDDDYALVSCKRCKGIWIKKRGIAEIYPVSPAKFHLHEYRKPTRSETFITPPEGLPDAAALGRLKK